ncbi:DUF29 domain-containing protein [Aphanothece sacrum]|uniref:DUF29 domain-containing protein n=1 Tax=Aphanothece sacrum FPU1 TaxID=1920663 RepID=A0A401II46_APHSA|nr:DUF29 domain-containing protein [Aphanothece sacrum]GBF80973.1 hypothetical protein AsFPU1_2382 [Aphanothece sacrum FPU1]GBF85280.1 hypothetical protein AsFPU3_2339 [Aphanothece sacrum FPU3]
MKAVKILYETDFNLWLQETVKLLKQKKLDQLDIDNLIEEIEAMGRSEKKGLRSNLEQLLMHLLKWKYQPNKRTGSWEKSILEHRNRILEDLEDSPSFNPYFDEIFDKCYQNARKYAKAETHLPLNIFPEVCSFTKTEILTSDYLPEDDI